MDFQISDEGCLVCVMSLIQKILSSEKIVLRLFDSAAVYESFYKFRRLVFDQFSADSVGVFHCLGAYTVEKALVITSCLLSMITTIRVDMLSL